MTEKAEVYTYRCGPKIELGKNLNQRVVQILLNELTNPETIKKGS